MKTKLLIEKCLTEYTIKIRFLYRGNILQAWCMTMPVFIIKALLRKRLSRRGYWLSTSERCRLFSFVRHAKKSEKERKKTMKKELNFDFLKENMMGPNCVRLLEELCRELTLPSKPRILDLGCGKGLTSIFLAQEFDAQVYATDLWITATENYQRFREFGLEDKIIPIHADAHDLPYADGYFDAVISIDSFCYYGARAGFVDEKIAPLLKKGGIIAIATPGLQRDFEDGIVPEEMLPYWEEDMNFYSKDWWKELWIKEKKITLTCCKSLESHTKAWNEWLQCDQNPYAVRDVDMMKAENGKYFDTIGLIATVK